MSKPNQFLLQDRSEERKFWGTHDSTDYIDWSTAERARLT
jgi:hypothetical protein